MLCTVMHCSHDKHRLTKNRYNSNTQLLWPRDDEDLRLDEARRRDERRLPLARSSKVVLVVLGMAISSDGVGKCVTMEVEVPPDSSDDEAAACLNSSMAFSALPRRGWRTWPVPAEVEFCRDRFLPCTTRPDLGVSFTLPSSARLYCVPTPPAPASGEPWKPVMTDAGPWESVCDGSGAMCRRVGAPARSPESKPGLAFTTARRLWLDMGLTRTIMFGGGELRLGMEHWGVARRKEPGLTGTAR